MRIHLDQIGCRLNYSEMETLAQRLRAAGHHIVARSEQAQVIIFNSCAVTAGAARDSRKRIGQLHRTNQGARIAVTGCLATLDPDHTAQLPGVTLVAGNEQKDLLPTLLEPWSAAFDNPDDLIRVQANGIPFDPAAEEEARGVRTRAFVKVQDGCDNRCTFCIVTTLRGESRSRPPHSIVEEIDRLVECGVQEAVLTGVHLGSYGRDRRDGQPVDLKRLVEAILSRTGITRLRLSSLEPWEMAPGFFDLWARWPGRLCPHLHLPLQAGTDRQLRHMARHCTTASFRQLMDEARGSIPDLVVTTDLIAGFPGETDRDFEEGMAFVGAMRFAHAHVFPFSARKGTIAATFDDQVSPDVKRERVQRLRRAVETTGRAERLRFMGSVRPVLWEGRGRPLADELGMVWTGYTDNYLRVVTTVTPSGPDLAGQVTDTRLDTMEGEVMVGAIV